MTPTDDILVWDWTTKLQWSGTSPHRHLAIPQGFESAAKILHEIEEDLSVADRELTWDQANRPGCVAGAILRTYLLGRRLVGRRRGLRDVNIELSLKAKTVRGCPAPGYPSRRIRWGTLADRYGVPFEPGIGDAWFQKAFPTGSWPRYLVGPDEGSLTVQETQALIACLRPFTTTATVCALYDGLATARATRCVYVGELEALTSLRSRPELCGNSPTLWWPEDRAWCVYSDWDLPYTLVAGARAAIDAVVAAPDVEAIKITATTDTRHPADR